MNPLLDSGAVASGPRPPGSLRTHPEPLLRVNEVSKVFGHGASAQVALRDVDLEVKRGEFVCVVGASGCGKSTLLALVAGLERPSSGAVLNLGSRPSFMFQEPALLPWLSVRRNVELPLRIQGVGKEHREVRVGELLSLVHLASVGERRPHQLSGGMKQRTALARSLAQGGDLLLLDEPFAALDAITRDLLHEELERVVATQGVAVLFVTHNVREAVRLGDRVVMMGSRPGHVEAEWWVDIPRPRAIETPAVGALATVITEKLREEMTSHVG